MTPASRDELDRLVFALYDGQSTAADRARLEFLLRDDPACRVRYLELSCLHASLGCRARELGVEAAPLPQKLGRRRLLVGTAAGLAATLCGIAWWRSSGQSDHESDVLLDRADGDVSIVDAQGREAGAIVGSVIKPGLTVVTGALDSTAVITLDRLTKVVLAGDTAVVFGGQTGSDLTLVRGMVAVDARDRAVDRPVRCSTPDAVLSLASTQATFDRADGQTRVAVLNGSVDISISDKVGSAVLVKAGEYATVGGTNSPAPQPLAPPPDVWKLDLEKKPRPRSLVGTVVSDALPPGSIAGLRSVEGAPGPHGPRYEIRTPNLWTAGAFSLYENTLLHVRYRTDRAVAVHVMIVSRGTASSEAQSCVNFFAQIPAKHHRVGEWQTAELPLTRFVPALKNHRKGPRIAAFVVLETRGIDAGLTVDEISASRV